MKKLLILIFLVLLIPQYSSSEEYLDTDNHGDFRGFSKHVFLSDVELLEGHKLEKTIAEFFMNEREHQITLLSDKLVKKHRDISMYLDTVFSDQLYFKMIVINVWYNKNKLGSVKTHLNKKVNGKLIVDVVKFLLKKENKEWKIGPIKKENTFSMKE